MAPSMHKLFYLLLLSCSVSSVTGETDCFDFFFHIPTDASIETGVSLPPAVYDICATYCPPTKYVAGRSDSTVQLFLHGGIDNKYYWSALGPIASDLQYQPGNYSWVHYARAEGYHTVAIDRLGTGSSSHPDPEYVRVFVQVEIINKIATILRRGGNNAFVSKFPGIIASRLDDTIDLPKFENIIGVGQSYGSFLLGLTLPVHPQAIDTAIFCGFIIDFRFATRNETTILGQVMRPGREVFPSRFGDLDPGYQTLAFEENYRASFFSRDAEFDPSVIHPIYSHIDVQATGEISSIFALLEDPNFLSYFNVTGKGFKGNVAFFVGDQDGPFCNGDCHFGPDNFVASSLAYYASARRSVAFEVPETGHMLNFHYSANWTKTTAHEWLAECGH